MTRVLIVAGLVISCYALFLGTAVARAGSDDSKITIMTGKDYLELPVGDRILHVVSKHGTLAFVVARDGEPPRYGQFAYAVDWHGHSLWSYHAKSYPAGAVATHLQSAGWTFLSYKNKRTFPNGNTIQRIDKPPINDCIAFAKTSLKANVAGTMKQGSFVRFLKTPERQYPYFSCGHNNISTSGDGYAIPVTSRLAFDYLFATTYDYSPNKVLLIDNGVAVFLKPDLSFYSDHPADYFFLPAATVDSIATEALSDVDDYENRGVAKDMDSKSVTNQLAEAIKRLDDLLGKTLKQ